MQVQELVLRKTPDAVEAAYRTHIAGAVRLAWLLTGDATLAQDVAHDAFVKAAGRLGGLRDERAFGAYLRRTVVRTVTQHQRARSRERTRLQRHAARADTPHAVADHGPGAADRVAVAAALAHLSARQRAAVVLRFWQDLPEAEIAAALRCRPGTVKSLLSRGLTILKEHLDER